MLAHKDALLRYTPYLPANRLWPLFVSCEPASTVSQPEAKLPVEKGISLAWAVDSRRGISPTWLGLR